MIYSVFVWVGGMGNGPEVWGEERRKAEKEGERRSVLATCIAKEAACADCVLLLLRLLLLVLSNSSCSAIFKSSEGRGSAAQVLRDQIPIPISGPAQSRSQYPMPIWKPFASWTFKVNFISFQYQVSAQSRSQYPISGPGPIHIPLSYIRSRPNPDLNIHPIRSPGPLHIPGYDIRSRPNPKPSTQDPFTWVPSPHLLEVNPSNLSRWEYGSWTYHFTWDPKSQAWHGCLRLRHL